MSQFDITDFAGWALRLILAQSVIVLFLLLTLVSFSMPHAGDFKPFFLLMAVYYWSIYRPTVMPAAYMFFLGLAVDILADLPVGLTALLLVGVQTVVQKSRLYLMGQSFVMVWLGFSITALAYSLSLWLLMSLSSFSLVSSGALTQTLIAAGLSVLLFPVASLALQGVHRLLPVDHNPMRAR